jgi:glutaredoxin
MIRDAEHGILEKRVKKQATIEVTFYTKAGCHLCEDARELLEEIAEQTEYTLTEIDIRHDPATFEAYRYRIPVILINQETLLEGRIDADELALAFQQAKGE